MHEELVQHSLNELHASGNMSNPLLCQKTLEYENYMLKIQDIQKQLDQLKENQNKDGGGDGNVV